MDTQSFIGLTMTYPTCWLYFLFLIAMVNACYVQQTTSLRPSMEPSPSNPNAGPPHSENITALFSTASHRSTQTSTFVTLIVVTASAMPTNTRETRSTGSAVSEKGVFWVLASTVILALNYGL